MKILIVYGTTEGQTRKIARYMEEHLQTHGHQVTISDAADEPPTPVGYDAVILGGSLHMMKHQTALAHYAQRNSEALSRQPSAFFSVSLGVVTGEESALKEAKKIAEEFVHQTAWSPEIIELIGGALKYTEYDYFKRYMMKMISGKAGGDTDTSHDHEYTDWNAVAAFCNKVVSLPQVKVN